MRSKTLIPPPPDAPGIPPPPTPPFEPPRTSGLSRGTRTTIAVVVIIAVVMVGIIGYAVVGFAYTSGRVAAADRGLNTVVSHQNSLNTTFKDIDTKFSGLNNGSTFDAVQAKALMSQFVANAQAAGITVDKDDASLIAALSSLDDQKWLTVLSRGSLDKEKSRIDHARKALADAKTVAADYVQDGQFLQAFIDAATDLDTLGSQSSSSDLTGAKATLATMKTHVDKALQLSSAPGLPTELHSLMVDFESLVANFGKLLDAVAAGNVAAITTSESAAEADANKISAYNFDTIGTQIDAFYKPLLDDFNSEMAKATV